MRKLFVTAAAAAGLTLAAATVAAQGLPPAVLPRVPSPPAVSAPRPTAPDNAAPVGLAAHYARLRNDPLLSGVASDSSIEGQAIGAMRVLLRDRGFGPDVTTEPMTALPPGAGIDAAERATADELDALVGPGDQPEAWLIQTDAGRWWLGESGAAAPADKRAEVYQAQAARRAQAEGRAID